MSQGEASPPVQTREALNCGRFPERCGHISGTRLSPVGNVFAEEVAACASTLCSPWRSPHREAGVGTFFGQSCKSLQGNPAQMGKLRPRGQRLSRGHRSGKRPSHGRSDSSCYKMSGLGFLWAANWDGVTCLQGSSVNRCPEMPAAATPLQAGPCRDPGSQGRTQGHAAPTVSF